jgi:N-sulfoglucosamine sulfohydrolase
VQSNLVSSIDLLPTFQEAAGETSNLNLPGKSLQPLFNRSIVDNWRKYLYAERTGGMPLIYFPQRAIRDKRFKLILSLLHCRSNPTASYYKGLAVESGSSAEEIAQAKPQVRSGYEAWEANPWEYAHPWRLEPRIELYDLSTDPHEFNNLAGDPKYREVKKRLYEQLQSWRKETDDPLLDINKLSFLTEEMDSVVHQYQIFNKTPYEITRDESFSFDYPEYLGKSFVQ